MLPNDPAQQLPPETPGRLQESVTNYPNGPAAQRGGGSLGAHWLNILFHGCAVTSRPYVDVGVWASINGVERTGGDEVFMATLAH